LGPEGDKGLIGFVPAEGMAGLKEMIQGYKARRLHGRERRS